MSAVTTTSNHYQHLAIPVWREKNNISNSTTNTTSSANNHSNKMAASNDLDNLSNVDDGLTSLSWLQNLNMCMTRLGAPTPPTPPASPVCFNFNGNHQTNTVCTVRLQPEKRSNGNMIIATTNSHQHSNNSNKTKITTVNQQNNNHNSVTTIIGTESTPKNSKNSVCNVKQLKICQNNKNNNEIEIPNRPNNIDSVSESNSTTTTMINNNNFKPETRNSLNKKKSNRKSISAKSTQVGLKKNPTTALAVVACINTNHHHNNGQMNDTQSTITTTTTVENNNNNQNPASSYHSEMLSSSTTTTATSIDYKLNGDIKPPYSYATLICMAMKANKNKMTLSAIYKWIKENFLYYQNADPSWQNSIRHNLSLNKCFIKIARNKDEPGKGGFWKLDPSYADSLVDGVFKKRRPNSSSSSGKQQHGRTGGQENGGNGNSGSIKKKSRKKRSSTVNNSTATDFYVSYIDNSSTNHHQQNIQQETPPSSAESYNAFKEHKMIDINELNNAINSIDNHCTTYTTYSFPSNADLIADCSSTEQNMVQGYSNEVCIVGSGQTISNNECIIEPDGGDMCWNAILTDVDLSELVDPIAYTDSVTQIIHPIETANNESSSSVNKSTNRTTTAHQLTAVEPNDLKVISNMPSTPSLLIDEQQLFYHDNSHSHSSHHHHHHSIHSLSFDAQPNNVITATSNVVTCINDTGDNLTDHWANQWATYADGTASNDDGSMQLDCPNSASTINSELILSQMEHDQTEVNMNDINLLANDDRTITYVTTTIPSVSNTNNNNNNANKQQLNNNQSTTLTLNPMAQQPPPQQSITNDIHSSTQTSPTNSFEANTIQVWECKANPMDPTATLELVDNFNNLDQLNQF